MKLLSDQASLVHMVDRKVRTPADTITSTPRKASVKPATPVLTNHKL